MCVCVCNVTLRRVRRTIVAIKRGKYRDFFPYLTDKGLPDAVVILS